MSLPVPSTSPANSTKSNNGGMSIDPKQLQALDAPLIALTQQCGGDLRRVFFAFFSFLNRRTDFYLIPPTDDDDDGENVGGENTAENRSGGQRNAASMGFREGDAEKLLLAAFRQFPLRRLPKAHTATTTRSGGAGAAAAATTTPAPISARTSSLESPSTKSSTIATTSKENSSKTKNPASDSNCKQNDERAKERKPDVRYTEEGLQVPVGNGGSAKTYKWTQTIEECSVLVGVPTNLRGKDIDVQITPTRLSVRTKRPLSGETSHHTFVQGILTEKVRSDESTWSLEGGVVIVTLEKMKPTFWKSILEGDEAIDTELVDNRRHIDEYDDATQAQIRKIIFDQEQYHKGAPTADEILSKAATATTTTIDGNKIPPLPKGVEYIDKKKLDEEDEKKASNRQ